MQYIIFNKSLARRRYRSHPSHVGVCLPRPNRKRKINRNKLFLRLSHRRRDTAASGKKNEPLFNANSSSHTPPGGISCNFESIISSYPVSSVRRRNTPTFSGHVTKLHFFQSSLFTTRLNVFFHRLEFEYYLRDTKCAITSSSPKIVKN